MSSEQLASVLNIKDSYLRSHWPKIVESYGKQNIQLFKVGRGASAIYGIQFPWDTEPAWDTDSLDYYE